MNRMRMGTRIIGAFLVVSAIALAIGSIGYRGLRRTSASMEDIVTNRLPAIPALLRIGTAMREIIVAQRTLLVPGINGAFAAEQARIVDKARDTIRQAMDRLTGMAKTPEEQQRIEALVAILQQTRAANDQLFAKIHEWEKDKTDLLATMDVLATTLRHAGHPQQEPGGPGRGHRSRRRRLRGRLSGGRGRGARRYPQTSFSAWVSGRWWRWSSASGSPG